MRRSLMGRIDHLSRRLADAPDADAREATLADAIAVDAGLMTREELRKVRWTRLDRIVAEIEAELAALAAGTAETTGA